MWQICLVSICIKIISLIIPKFHQLAQKGAKKTYLYTNGNEQMLSSFFCNSYRDTQNQLLLLFKLFSAESSYVKNFILPPPGSKTLHFSRSCIFHPTNVSNKNTQGRLIKCHFLRTRAVVPRFPEANPCKRYSNRRKWENAAPRGIFIAHTHSIESWCRNQSEEKHVCSRENRKELFSMYPRAHDADNVLVIHLEECVWRYE